MEQNAPGFSPNIFLIWIILPMYHDFLGPRELQWTHMDTLRSKNSNKGLRTEYCAKVLIYIPRFHEIMTLEKMNNNSWAKKLLTLSVQNITSILELPYLYAYSTNSSKKEQRIRRRRSTFLGKMTGSAAGRECFIIAILFPEIYQFICQNGIEL